MVNIMYLIFFILITNGYAWHSYKFLMTNLTVDYVNPDYLSTYTLNLNVDNPVPSFDVKMISKKEIEKPFFVNVVAYQKKNDVYVYSLLNATLDICSYLDHTSTSTLMQMFYPLLIKNGNFPRSCPFKKGEYYARNIIFDEEKLPTYIPGEFWMFTLKLSDGDILISTSSFYIHIDYSKAVKSLTLLNYGK